MISTSENQVIYLGNGVNTHFSYNFKIINYTDLHLIRVDSDGNETEVTSDFYVHMDTSIVDYPGYAPGAVEPVADQPLPLQTGEKIVIYRDIPITQEDDMPEQWPFDVLEDALDKSCIIDQQLQEQINRGLKINRSAYTSNFDGTIPVVAGKSFRISDDGKSIEATDDPAEARSAAEGAANTASASAATASAAATRAESAASTATTKKNETQTLATSVITKLEELKHDGIWEYDLNVDLQPVENPMQNRYFERDDDGNLTPIDVSTMVGGLHQAVIGKQDKLTAGANITIQNNVISASGGVSDAYTKAETDTLLSAKANTSTTYSKDEVDGQFSTVSGDITQLFGDIANCSSAIETVGNKVDVLQKMAKGILYEYQTDSTEAYSKSIPSGAKVMDLNMVQAGKSFRSAYRGAIQWHQGFVSTNTLTVSVNSSYPNAIYEIIEFKSGDTVSITCGTNARIRINGDNASACDSVITKLGSYATVSYEGATNEWSSLTSISMVFNQSIKIAFLILNGEQPTNEIYLQEPAQYATSIVTVNAQQVVVKGKNLVNPANKLNGLYLDGTGSLYTNDGMKTIYIPIAKGQTYTIKQSKETTMMRYNFTVDFPAKNVKTYNYKGDAATFNNLPVNTSRTVSVEGDFIKYLVITYWRNTSTVTEEEAFNSLQVEKGSTATAYTPYTAPTTITIPTALAQGKSAESVYDSNEFYSVETDGVTKYYCKHTQRVGSVVLDGVTSGRKFNGNLGNLSSGLYGAFWTSVRGKTRNVVSDKFIYSPNGVDTMPLYSFIGGSGVSTTWAFILPSTITSLTEANEWLQSNNTTIYYELSEPIVTTTELSQNLFEALTVEGGGSITFVGNNTDYHLPMANSEEYLVYLNEV